MKIVLVIMAVFFVSMYLYMEIWLKGGSGNG